jgi:hypothetical protein
MLTQRTASSRELTSIPGFVGRTPRWDKLLSLCVSLFSALRYNKKNYHVLDRTVDHFTSDDASPRLAPFPCSIVTNGSFMSTRAISEKRRLEKV